MAKQKGIFKVQGTLDNATFYERDGKSFVKKKSEGPSKERIKNDPNYIRTRENGQEFGGGATVASGLQQGFVLVAKMLDGKFNIRAKSLCRKVIDSAPAGVRGQRPFLSSVAATILPKLVFHKNSSFDSICNAPYTITVTVGRYQASVLIPDFNTGNLISAPSGATHFQFLLYVSALSSYEWDSNLEGYKPTNTEHNTKHGMQYSAHIPLGGMVGASTSLQALLHDVEELPEDMLLLVSIGIQFSQLMSGVHYNLASNNAIKIVTVE